MRALKVLGHDALTLCSLFTRRGRVHPGNPSIGTLIEPTSVCNLRCPYCPTTEGRLERSRKFIEVETFERIVALTRPFTEYYTLNLFGEPMLHPEIFRLLDMLADKPVWLSTNLNYPVRVAEKLASYRNIGVICSVDGWDEPSYLSYRIGGSFPRVAENLAILARGQCRPYPQFLLTPETQAHLPEIKAFVSNAGVSLKNLRLSQLEENFANRFEQGLPGKCHAPYSSLYFTCDGHLIPCCNNVGNDLLLDHVDNMRTPDDALNSPALVRARRLLSIDKNIYKSCRSCPGGDLFPQKALARVRGYANAALTRLGWPAKQRGGDQP